MVLFNVTGKCTILIFARRNRLWSWGTLRYIEVRSASTLSQMPEHEQQTLYPLSYKTWQRQKTSL